MTSVYTNSDQSPMIDNAINQGPQHGDCEQAKKKFFKNTKNERKDESHLYDSDGYGKYLLHHGTTTSTTIPSNMEEELVERPWYYGASQTACRWISAFLCWCIGLITLIPNSMMSDAGTILAKLASLFGIAATGMWFCSGVLIFVKGEWICVLAAVGCQVLAFLFLELNDRWRG